MRMTGWRLAVSLGAFLGVVSVAAAQTSGPGPGAGTGSAGAPSGTAGGTGPGATGSSSPGVTTENGSDTGIAIPHSGPVDSRTHQPAQVGTASIEPSPGTTGTGSGPAPLTDLTQEGTGSSATSDKTAE